MANASTVSGTALGGAASSDPDLCRISGYLKNLSGTALAGWRFVIRHIHEPYVDGTTDVILQEAITVTADSDGLVDFELLQGATVRVEITNRILDFVMERLVPSETSADLVDFLFPYIVSLAWDDGASATVESGETLTLGVTATLSNGDTLELENGVLEVTAADEDVLVPVAGAQFTGGDVGSTTVSLDDVDTDEIEIYQETDGDVIGRLNTPSITLPSDITVTVT